MVQRIATFWKGNTAKADGIAYSDATVAYSSASASYSSSSVALDEFSKSAGTWTPVAKTSTGWNANVSALVNQYAYDSASQTYDSTVDTYDGIVAGQDSLNTSNPAAWSTL